MKSNIDILKVFTLEMDSSETIEDIKEKISKTEGIVSDQNELYNERKSLDTRSGASLKDYNLNDGSTIFLVPRLMEIFVEGKC